MVRYGMVLISSILYLALYTVYYGGCKEGPPAGRHVRCQHPPVGVSVDL